MEGNNGLIRCSLFLVKEDIESALNDLLNGLVVIYIIEYSPLNSFDQPFPAHLLFHGQDSYTALVGLFRITFLVQDRGDIGLNIRTNTVSLEIPVKLTTLNRSKLTT